METKGNEQEYGPQRGVLGVRQSEVRMRVDTEGGEYAVERRPGLMRDRESESKRHRDTLRELVCLQGRCGGKTGASQDGRPEGWVGGAK